MVQLMTQLILVIQGHLLAVKLPTVPLFGPTMISIAKARFGMNRLTRNWKLFKNLSWIWTWVIKECFPQLHGFPADLSHIAYHNIQSVIQIDQLKVKCQFNIWADRVSGHSKPEIGLPIMGRIKTLRNGAIFELNWIILFLSNITNIII